MNGIGEAWLYGRKSSYRGKQKGRGRSVREQLSEGRLWCDEHGVPVAGEYVDDDRSASRLGSAGQTREDFERLITDIEDGRIRPGDVVVTWEASRLYRDLAVYVQLRDACWRAGVLWCINGRLYDLSRREDRKASAYDAIQAEDEAYEISDRVKRTLRSNAAAGRPHGVNLWGYRRVFDPDTGDLVQVVIDEEIAGILRPLWYQVRELRSIGSIRAELNRRGIRSPAGKTWAANKQVTSLLRNPAYIGKRVHRGQIVGEAMWPPILALDDGSPDEETFYAVQAILDDRTRQSTRDAAVKHLISGIATCAICHRHAWAAPHHSGYRKYWCVTRAHFSCKADPIDDYVTYRVVSRLAGPEAKKRYALPRREDAGARKMLSEIARWRAELNEGEQLVEAGELTMARLAKMEQRLLPKIEAAERQLGDQRVNPLVAGLIRPSVDEVFLAWQQLEITQKRAVLRAMLQRLEIGPVGIGRRGVPPEEHVTLEWRKRSLS
jgi:DNA invertase Pin-like site-specific DNA recombinase